MIVFEKKNFYFRGFKLIPYVLQNEDLEVLDFLHRWKIAAAVRDNISSYSFWTVRDSDSLRGIAKTLYGSEHYYWVIMMMNDMVDPFYDWPLNETSLRKHVIDHYGIENIYDVHHYVSGNDASVDSLPAGHIVSYDYPFSKVAVNNYDYCSSVNESKRNIKLLKPEFLSKLKSERERILANNFGG